MQTVPTANVLIAFHPDPLRQVFEGKTDMGFISKSAKIKDVLLFNNKENNFLKLEHDFAFSDGGESGGRESKIILEFIDPDSQFEERFLDISLSKILASVLQVRKKLDIKIEEQEEKLQHIKNLNEFIKSLKEEKANLELTPFEKFFDATFPGDLEGPAKELQENIDEHEDMLSRIERELIDVVYEREILENQLQNRHSRKIWIMYGCGSDVNDWAGPFVCKFIGSTYNYAADGVRKITLTFVSNYSLFKDNNEIDSTGLSAYIEGRVHVNLEQDINEFSIWPLNLQNVHTYIRSCIQSYVSNSIGSSNVIVLLPNLNVILADFIANIQSEVNRSFLNTNFPNVNREMFRMLVILENIFERLGFSLVEDFDTNFASAEEHIVGIGLQAGADLPYRTLEYNTDDIDAANKILENNKFYISLVSNKQNPKTVLDNLFKKCNELGGGLIRPEFVWENNHYVLELIKKYLRPDIDVNEPLLIVGDTILIQRFIYGDFNLENFAEEVGKVFMTEQDRETYINQSYLEEIQKFLVERTVNHCFERSITLPDHFAFHTDDLELLKKTNTPIFKSGVQNSNILSVTFNISDFFFVALNTVYAYENIHRSTPSIDQTLTLEPNINSILDVTKYLLANWDDKYLDDIFAYLRSEDITIGGDLLGSNETENEELIGSVMKFLVMLEGMYPGAITRISEFANKNPYSLTLRSILEASRAAFTGSIKTLPMFSISNLANLFRPSLLLLKELRIVNQKQTPVFGDVVNGIWNIFGFKHHISKGSIYSAFNLTKDPSFSPMRLANSTKPKVDQAFEYEVTDAN